MLAELFKRRPKMRVVGTYLPEVSYQRIKKLAKERGPRSVAAVARYLIELGLKNMEKRGRV